MNTTPSAEDPRARAARLSFRNQALIDGKFVDAASGRKFACVSPIDGKTLTHVAECDLEDVDRAVRASRKAFEQGVWSRTAPAQRKRVLYRLADLVLEHADELALLETLDMGKPIRYSTTVDAPKTADCIAWCAEAIDKLYDEVAPTAPTALALITREALGDRKSVV